VWVQASLLLYWKEGNPERVVYSSSSSGEEAIDRGGCGTFAEVGG